MAKKYEQIRQVLRKRLADGTYRVGMRLPTEGELADSFSVNRHTLRKALDGLVEEGYIDRAPRRGCVVVATGEHAGLPQTVRLRCFTLASSCASLEVSLDAALKPHMAANPDLKLDIAVGPHIGPVLSPHAPERHGGDVPTVCRLAYVADYAASGELLPLDQFPDYAEVVTALEGRLVYPTENSASQRHIHALPTRSGTWMMLVNRTLLADLGLSPDLPVDTWDELLEAARQIKKASDGTVYTLDLELLAQPTPASIARYTPWFLNAGEPVPFVDERTRAVAVNTEPRRAVIQMFRRMLDEGWCRPGGPVDGFLAGRTVFRMACQWDGLRHSRQLLPGADLAPLSFPVRHRGMPSRTVMRGFFAGILRATVPSAADQDAAWRVLKGLLSADVQTARLQRDNCAPSRTDLGYCMVDCSDDVDRFYEYGARYGMPAMDFPGIGEINRILCHGFRDAILDPAGLTSAMRNAQDLLEAYLGQDAGDVHASAPAVEVFL